MIPILLAAAARAGMTAATLAPLVKPAIGIVKRFVTRPSARPGVGSVVTKGPLKVGGQVVYGAKGGVSTAAKVAGAAAGAVGAGVATVASHRQTRPATGPSPRRSTPAPSATSTDRKCCPAGTKRMVCFKRGRVKGKPHAAKPIAHRSRAKKARRTVKRKAGSGVPKRAVSAKQAAARKRFAAAARKGPIQKGSRL